MNQQTVVFTETDRKILSSYMTVVDGLGEFFGNSFEIVIYSMENLDESLIKIVNGANSGRNIGSPITDVALSMMTKMVDSPNNNQITYFGKNNRGEQFKSVITAIRGERNRLIGLFCVNFYLDTPLSSFLQNFAPAASVAANSTFSENFVDNAEDFMLSALEEAKRIVYNDLSISSSNKNKEIVAYLYNKGIFNLKDSVISISNRLGISKNTVYMHIRNLTGK